MYKFTAKDSMTYVLLKLYFSPILVNFNFSILVRIFRDNSEPPTNL